MPEREVVIVEEKPWWASRTVWFNVIAGALLALEMNLPSLQGTIDAGTYAYLLVTVNIVNVILRTITKAPVTLR